MVFIGHCLLCASLCAAGEPDLDRSDGLSEDGALLKSLAQLWMEVSDSPFPLDVDAKVGGPLGRRSLIRDLEVYLNGKRLDLRRIGLSKRQAAAWLAALMARKSGLGCPAGIAPGKYTLRFRYRTAERWSDLSKPTEVTFPKPPEIIAVANADLGVSSPLPDEGVASVSWPTWRMRLSNVKSSDDLVIFVDGHPITDRQRIETNGTVSITPNVPPGVYSLRVQRVPTGAFPQLASRPSEPVLVRYQPNRYRYRVDGNEENEHWLRVPSASGCSSGPKVAAVSRAAREDAFASMPQVTPIPEAAQRVLSGHEDETPDGESSPYTRHFRLLPAAHFPLHDLGPEGQSFDREGAVIYEDMRFSWKPGGNYRVSFVLQTPHLPTTLRLRLLVRASDDSIWHSVTLPPIRVQPETTAGSHAKPLVWRVEHQGYSATIDRMGDQVTAIRREGTARFGYGASPY